MLQTRKLKNAVLHQIVELSGPTHDAQWMLPDLASSLLEQTMDWMAPGFWMPATNRLIFTMKVFVLVAGSDIILIDTGVGNHKQRLAPSHAFINTPLIDWLRGIDCAPERITHVINTHLHGDHVGWNTTFVEGKFVPTFPNATYCMPSEDWRVFDERRATGTLGVHTLPFDDSVRPIVDAGLARFIEPGTCVAGILTALPAPGHSPGQLAFELRDGDDRFLFAADVIHTPIQVLQPNINSRWCEYPEVARRTRMSLLSRAADENLTILTAHAFDINGWTIHHNDAGFAVRVS
jgi:glyoxylase-like metal-dependent hydrolase (beta-lactamase superfamily II)